MTAWQEFALIVVLAAALVVVSAAAGAFWWRSRSVPLLRAAQLARELIERQRRLEDIIERLEKTGVFRSPLAEVGGRPLPAGPRSSSSARFDPAQPSAVTGPTLIAVPDLSAPPPEPSPAAAELAQRFGAIWERADRGEPADLIARATGQPIGQVELVLGLRRQLAVSERRDG